MRVNASELSAAVRVLPLYPILKVSLGLTLKDFDWEEKFVEELYDHQGNDIVQGQTVYEIFESNIGLTVYSIGDNYGIMFDKYNITLDAYVTTELFSNGYQLDQGMITFKDLIAYFDEIY